MKKFYLIPLISFIIFVSGCKKEENPVAPADDPIASFIIEGSTETSVGIKFINTSKNADSYIWQFGDGTSSNEANPIKTYNTMGSYTVTLTAINSRTGKSHRISQSINIRPSKVFLQRIYLDDFPFVDRNGNAWDLFSGPDVFFAMRDTVPNLYINGSRAVYSDVTPSMLPLWWDFTPELDFPKNLWYKTFFIGVFDMDDTGVELIGETEGFRIADLIASNYATTLYLRSPDLRTKLRLIVRWQ